MRLCWLGIHKWTHWRVPRKHVQTRMCMYCNLYERTMVLINLPGATDDILTVPEYPEIQEEMNDNSQIDEV